jgi:phosphohistidine phosphatase
MQLFLMRHGEAVSPSEWSKSDSQRPLTPIGVAKLQEALAEMKRSGFSVPCVLTSPYERAQQTAAMLCSALSLSAPLVRPEFGAGASIESLRKGIAPFLNQVPVLFVGHMPEIAIFGSRITTEPWVMDRGLEPAEVLAIEIDTLEKWGGGRVLWSRKVGDWKKVGV